MPENINFWKSCNITMETEERKLFVDECNAEGPGCCCCPGITRKNSEQGDRILLDDTCSVDSEWQHWHDIVRPVHTVVLPVHHDYTVV